MRQEVQKTDLCVVCGRETFQFFCHCHDSDTMLCKDCVKPHFLEDLGTPHSLLPVLSYGLHTRPGFFERLAARRKSMNRGKEELLKSVKVIDTCKADLHAKIDHVISRLHTYKDEVTLKLDSLRTEAMTEVEESLREIEASVFTDNLASSKPLTKLMWDYKGESVEIFNYSIDVNPILSSVDKILKIDKGLPGAAPDRRSDFMEGSLAAEGSSSAQTDVPPDPADEIQSGYWCPYCKQNIKHKYHLKDHFNLHIKENLYRCPICESLFMKRNLFKTHIQSSHPEESFRKLLNRSQDFEQRGSQPLDCICMICHEHISTKEALYDHSEMHSERYPCPLCKESAVELKQMECHLKRHVKDTRANFQCLVCNNKYKNLSTVRKHIDSIHSGISIDAAVKEIQSQVSPIMVCRVCKEPLRAVNSMLQHAEDHSRLGMELRKKIKSMELDGDDFSSDQRSESSGI